MRRVIRKACTILLIGMVIFSLPILVAAFAPPRSPLGSRPGSTPDALRTSSPPSAARALAAPTYEELGDEAIDALVRSFYNGDGYWRDCPEAGCWTHNSDWGSDALTNTLYLRWSTTRDAAVPSMLATLARTARTYAPACRGTSCLLWSDVPMWDSVAAAREYAATGDRLALQKARAAFAAVEASPVYDVGACPAIRYQRPFGRGDQLKTLETDSNGIKAALLLFEATHDARYRDIAMRRYDAVRQYFLDPERPLYSVYVFDDGARCRQVPHRYFASVNGNMIWNGIALYRITHRLRYRDEAYATAHAVATDLADPHGVFMDLQAENDLEEPLVEAMLVLATQEHRAFARRWLFTNASAAYSARKLDGTYGRFFDGPPPQGPVTAWQTSGGFASEIAAAFLEPHAHPSEPAWRDATFVPHEISSLPATIRFDGSGFALIGTIGDVCCQAGHARIFVDGVETMNRVGTWQNKSSSGQRLEHSVLFAWRWSNAGTHEVTLQPGIYDAKEGGAFLHALGYVVR